MVPLSIIPGLVEMLYPIMFPYLEDPAFMDWFWKLMLWLLLADTVDAWGTSR